MERNNRIFRGKESTPSTLASKIIDELHLWEIAGAKGVKCRKNSSGNVSPAFCSVQFLSLLL
uniref:Uncharacterized protein n=1 Tax=Oryza glumipatula TaxID=40148 RepID=A0A0D9Y258_9ORYZ